MPRVSIRVPLEELQPKPAQPIVEQPAAPEAPKPPRKPFNTKYLLYAGGVVLVLILVFILLNDRRHLKQEVNKLSTTTTTTANNGQADALKYQEEIGKIVELPTGQTPSLIPVTDAAKLASENSFFKNARNGDVVLLYVSADKSVQAVLYRPSSHKVVEATTSASVGGGSTGGQSTTPAPTTTPQTTTPTKK